MNEKIHKIIMFISVCLASFCVAAIVAVIIVDSKASQIDFKPTKPNYNGVSFSENIVPEKSISADETEASYDITENDTPTETEKTEETTTYNIEVGEGTDIENVTVNTEKKLRPSPKEVIKSIPFTEKTKILRKYLPKMSAQDIKYFTNLLKEKKPDFESANKRLLEIYTPEEITELYNIYKSYEEKIYESYS